MCKFCKLFQVIFAIFENCLSVQVIFFVAEIVGFAKCHSDVFLQTYKTKDSAVYQVKPYQKCCSKVAKV